MPLSRFSDYFSQRLYGKQYLNQFRKMAYTITNEYVEDVIKYIENKGFDPSFEEIITAVKKLENDLIIKGKWLRDDYKKERGKGSPRLTKGFKRIINSSINEYLGRTRVVFNIKPKITDYSIPCFNSACNLKTKQL